mgnify:CR=1 FL=1
MVGKQQADPSFAFAGKTLLTELRWWSPPVELEVSYVSVDDNYGEVDVHIALPVAKSHGSAGFSGEGTESALKAVVMRVKDR